MKTITKIFVIAFVAITMSTLTSCSSFKAIAIKKVDTEGIQPTFAVPFDYSECSDKKEVYILLENPKSAQFKRPGYTLGEYIYLEVKVKNEKTGEVLDVYAFDGEEMLWEFRKLKKGFRVKLYIQKDKQNKNQVLIMGRSSL